MKPIRCGALLAGLFMSGVATGAGQSGASQPSTPIAARQSNGEHNTANNKKSAAPDGAALFETHCGRCHNAPQEISPRVAKTVARHMLTRAMLSREDEQAILEFLAP